MEPSRNTSRRAAQRRRAARRRRTMLQFFCGLLILILAALLSFLLLFDPVDPVVKKLTLEAGSAVQPELFLTTVERNSGKTVKFITDVAAIDTKVPGKHNLQLMVDGKAYTCVLQIMDRIAPTADPVHRTTELGVLPEPETLVTNIQDVGSVTVSYKKEPDVSHRGVVKAEVLVTDAAGNSTVVRVELTVTSDEVPPVITGAVDLEIFIGEPIAYKAGITVTDDQTANPKLVVDNSRVDKNKAGVYPVIYTATDDAGNSTSVTVTLTIMEKPANYVEPDVVYAEAQKVLDRITTEDMTDMEVAFAIYRWVTGNIGYVGTSDKSSWTGAAYQAFTERVGDCYNYFAAAKALYEVAGIENVDVVKSDTSHSSHYWSLINLGDGWYHVDCTPRTNVGYFFMNTDAELEAYSVKNNNSHIFDGSLYPERATESVQDLVDYARGKVYG